MELCLIASAEAVVSEKVIKYVTVSAEGVIIIITVIVGDVFIYLSLDNVGVGDDISVVAEDYSCSCSRACSRLGLEGGMYSNNRGRYLFNYLLCG